MAGISQNYHETIDPAVTADESTITLAATNKGLLPAARYSMISSQFFNKIGRKLRIRAFGKMTTGATPGNLTVAILFGTGADANGTSLGAIAATALTANGTNLSWNMEVYIHCRTVGSSGGLFCTGFFEANPSLIASSSQPLLIPASAAAVTGSLDLTGTSIPSIQALRSGSTAETMTVQDYDISPMN